MGNKLLYAGLCCEDIFWFNPIELEVGHYMLMSYLADDGAGELGFFPRL